MIIHHEVDLSTARVHPVEIPRSGTGVKFWGAYHITPDYYIDVRVDDPGAAINRLRLLQGVEVPNGFSRLFVQNVAQSFNPSGPDIIALAIATDCENLSSEGGVLLASLGPTLGSSPFVPSASSVQRFAGTDPAAGADYHETGLLRSGAWEILGLTFLYTADANAANRILQVNFSKSSDTTNPPYEHDIFIGSADSAILAGDTARVICAPGLPRDAAALKSAAGIADQYKQIPLPQNLIVPVDTASSTETFTVHILSQTIQAGDQISDIHLLARRA